jgi:hypothetical protein
MKKSERGKRKKENAVKRRRGGDVSKRKLKDKDK